jgi:hypothetical protein
MLENERNLWYIKFPSIHFSSLSTMLLRRLHVADNNKTYCIDIFMWSARYFCRTFNKTFNFSTHFSKKSPVTIFLKRIRPLGAHLIHVDSKTERERERQTDITKLIFAFRDYMRMCLKRKKKKHHTFTASKYNFFKNTLLFLIMRWVSVAHFLKRSGDSTYMWQACFI